MRWLFLTLAFAAFLNLSAHLNASIPEEVGLGEKLSKEDAAKLEKLVAENPNDPTNRYKLLGYYFLKKSSPDEAANAKHICWLIEKDPESELAGSPFVQLHAPFDRHYFDVERTWLETIKRHPDNLKILRNAAALFYPSDPDEFNRLYQLAAKVDPKDQWFEDHKSFIKDNQVYDVISSGEMVTEEQLQKTPSRSGIGRFYQLSRLAKSAYKKGELQQAIDFANELLVTSARYTKDWNYGNAVHDGNMVLGLVALKGGDRDRAAQYLQRAGGTPGSPQANSFGPNMSLAKKLFEAGERKAVLEYFKLCRKFWKMGHDELDLWSKEVEYGKLPSFGVHLIH